MRLQSRRKGFVITTPLAIDFNPARLLRALREVIRAVDWRAPRVGGPGGVRVAEETQRLRRQVVARLEELTRPKSGAHEYDVDLVEAIMTDDGGRQRDGGLNW